jgi:hypothetical protein
MKRALNPWEKSSPMVYVLSDRGIRLNLGTKAPDELDFPVKHIPGKTVFGNTRAQHPPGGRELFKDGYPIPFQGQVVGRAQSSGTGADDGHRFRSLLLLPWRLLLGSIRHKSLQIADGNGFIKGSPITFRLTRVVTYPSQYARKGKIFIDELKGLFVLALGDQGDVALDIHPGRTRHHTRGPIPLVDGKDIGKRLSVGAIDGLTVHQALVEFTGNPNGADVGTFSAAGTFRRIHVPRFSPDGRSKMTRLPLNVQHLRVGEGFYVEVSAALHQFRGEDTHGTVIGGKGLVQLGHHSADGRGGFHEVDEVPRFR